MPLICLKSKRLLAATMLALVWFAGLDRALAQINRTWNGSVSSDWFNATNWIPAGVPASNDIVNFTNGAIIFLDPASTNYLDRFYRIFQQ